MARSNPKGARGEKEWAAYVSGVKVSRRGYEGPDVESPPARVGPLTVWEVKLRKTLPAWLEDWMAQVQQHDAHAVAFRRNRGEWWILAPASLLVIEGRDAEGD